MISRQDFADEHDAEFQRRPQRIQALRVAFREYVDLTPPRSPSEVLAWYDDHKSVVTRRLNDHQDDGDSGGDQDPDGDESGGGE